MNIKTISTIIAAAPLILSSQLADAAVIGLFDWSLNIDGTVSEISHGDPVPAGVDVSGFDDITGLGTITATISGAGAHFFDIFVDHEIDELINTYYNEFGSPHDSPVAVQSCEIDEPGFFGLPPGDIYDNFLNSTLDNTNGVPITFEDDVSMAIGWDFSLTASETATISMLISETRPDSGFYLEHSDSGSQASIFFNSALVIGGPAVPEPAVIWLIGLGLFSFAAQYKLRKTV